MHQTINKDFVPKYLKPLLTLCVNSIQISRVQKEQQWARHALCKLAFLQRVFLVGEAGSNVLLKCSGYFTSKGTLWHSFNVSLNKGSGIMLGLG